ncbi:ParB N-terminal domain-containing protein [Amorphus orientalis]|uniref:ParB-like chromosome segregation protein Spo0J n=1 Tax=Amorphus orientalis TaxID=649198 RepID=A0AAE3VKF9_9HYPH|nr:ParB N-terminal domain-containing protein [Amorphus orientalis]MDQ0313657.1 ParB-like chromosome segregation protein Spo0J [Amorphus orientalis]
MSGQQTIASRTIDDLRQLPFHVALDLLRSAESIVVPGDTSPESLPVADIVTLENVFQHRVDEGTELEREQHAKDLAIALKQKPPEDRTLDPILVKRLEDQWVCIDGHHRLAAYEKAGVTRAPVQAFEGSVDDALRAAARENTKAKLSFTKRDRMNLAWRMTTQRVGSKREVSQEAGISTSQVGKMRKMREDIEAVGEKPERMTYREAMSFLSDTSADRDEGWEDRQIADFERRLSKEFGKSLHKNASLFATALGNFSPSAVRAIVQDYAKEHREAIEAILGEEDE